MASTPEKPKTRLSQRETLARDLMNSSPLEYALHNSSQVDIPLMQAIEDLSKNIENIRVMGASSSLLEAERSLESILNYVISKLQAEPGGSEQAALLANVWYNTYIQTTASHEERIGAVSQAINGLQKLIMSAGPGRLFPERGAPAAPSKVAPPISSGEDLHARMSALMEKSGNSGKLDLSGERTIRILVDFGSIQKGMGAPEASLQLMKGIRDRYGFKGDFELIPVWPQPLANDEATLLEAAKLKQKAMGILREAAAREKSIIVELEDVEKQPPCRFGFTGAYDRNKNGSKSDELYDRGMGCQAFITLSTQGWYTFQDSVNNERMGPSVYTPESGRQNVSVHLPRKDVLALNSSEIEALQKSKSEIGTLRVVLYKLDQEKNHLTKQRSHILEALNRYAKKIGKKIEVIEVTGSESAMPDPEYDALKINRIQPNLKPHEYHGLLASAHGVFCEGQSTGSQAMLYGATAFHVPLDHQGVNIHASNAEVAQNVLTGEEMSYTTQMRQSCNNIREKGGGTFYPIDQEKTLWKKAHNDGIRKIYDDAIELGLGAKGLEHAQKISQKIRNNENLDMIAQCISKLPDKLLNTEPVSSQGNSSGMFQYRKNQREILVEDAIRLVDELDNLVKKSQESYTRMKGQITEMEKAIAPLTLDPFLDFKLSSISPMTEKHLEETQKSYKALISTAKDEGEIRHAMASLDKLIQKEAERKIKMTELMAGLIDEQRAILRDNNKKKTM